MKTGSNYGGGFRALPAVFFLFFLVAMAGTLHAADLDNDGLPDDWESRFAEGGAFSLTRNDADGDPDGDGLNNLEEFESGTHPLVADTDGDGLTDWEELFVYGTNPAVADTDGGGWSDGREVSAGLNPLNPDDDGDEERTRFTLQLNEGWNLVSFPVRPPDTNIGRLLLPIEGRYNMVWEFSGGAWRAFNPENPGLSTLTEMVPGRGYWVDMNSSALLHLVGPPVSSAISLSPGWNLVGLNFLGEVQTPAAFQDLGGIVTNVWKYEGGLWRVFDPRNPGFSNLPRLAPGFGYWIKAETAGTLRIP